MGSEQVMSETTVVLATYNGERYIAEFLESLIAQSYRDFDVVVSDDGSTDETVSIVETFQNKLNISISISPTNAGPSLNFSRATQMANGEFIAFADQDDVWQPDKLLLMVDLIKTYDPKQPTLVFCDLEIVDQNLDKIAPSFFSDKKSSACRKVEDFIVSNHIPGCAMLVNRSLLDLGLPVPPLFWMHDWWFAIIAAAFGKIAFLDRPLIRYRQHAGNVIGAQVKASETLISKVRRLAITPRLVFTRRIRAIQWLADTTNKNLAAFTERFGGSLGDRDRKVVRAFQNRRFIFSRLRILSKANLGDSSFNALVMSFLI
jgi:glycosyltransferase involved in cell wall biosynthesis